MVTPMSTSMISLSSMWKIDGKELNSENELREFAMNYSPQGRHAFKQDFRLANGARTKPVSEIIDLLQANGAQIEQI